MKNDLKFSVCIPTYNMGYLIGDVIRDVLAQSFANFEIIISDNNSQDDTEKIVKSFKDERMQFFKNETNVGYARNLQLCLKRSNGDIVYLLSAKSRISKDALQRTREAFMISEDIGAVTRPYYWYGKDLQTPVRAKDQYAKGKDAIISIHDDIKAIIAVFKTLDNPGGLAFRKSLMDMPFSEDYFVEFTYPFAAIFKKHQVVYLKDYVMACPAFSYSASQNPAVYKKSPIQSWVDLFNNIFYEKEFEALRRQCIKNFVAVNYIGLVQVRNYSPRYVYLLREIFMLIKYRWQNLFKPIFWFFSIATMIMPRSILIPLVESYKKKVNSSLLKNQDISLKI